MRGAGAEQDGRRRAAVSDLDDIVAAVRCAAAFGGTMLQQYNGRGGSCCDPPNVCRPAGSATSLLRAARHQPLRPTEDEQTSLSILGARRATPQLGATPTKRRRNRKKKSAEPEENNTKSHFQICRVTALFRTGSLRVAARTRTNRRKGRGRAFSQYHSSAAAALLPVLSHKFEFGARAGLGLVAPRAGRGQHRAGRANNNNNVAIIVAGRNNINSAARLDIHFHSGPRRPGRASTAGPRRPRDCDGWAAQTEYVPPSWRPWGWWLAAGGNGQDGQGGGQLPA